MEYRKDKKRNNKVERRDEVTGHTAAMVPAQETIARSCGSCSAPLAVAGSSCFNSLNITSVHLLSLVVPLLYIEDVSQVQEKMFTWNWAKHNAMFR